MAAATGNRAKLLKPSDKVSYPVAASTNIFKDTMVSTNAAGDAVPTGISAANLFQGFAESRHDNSAGVAGAMRCPVLKEGTCTVIYGPGSPTKALNGKKAYALDDQTVTDTVTTNAPYVGEFVYDDDPDVGPRGLIRIRINKAVN
ncbi:hypothetical protein EON79_03685 [bacterium]|nr:MAG: hypothetical protein EON79_03685 [bacterium]